LLCYSTGWPQQLSGAPIPNPPTLCVTDICPSASVSAPPPSPSTPTTPTTPPPAGAAVKWHPGTYVWVSGIPNSSQTPQILTDLGAICSNANIAGIQVALKWTV